MSFFDLKAHIELCNLYKIGNIQKHFDSHVIKFFSVTHDKRLEAKRKVQ
jgi:hypothetical protein